MVILLSLAVEWVCIHFSFSNIYLKYLDLVVEMPFSAARCLVLLFLLNVVDAGELLTASLNTVTA